MFVYRLCQRFEHWCKLHVAFQLTVVMRISVKHFVPVVSVKHFIEMAQRMMMENMELVKIDCFL